MERKIPLKNYILLAVTLIITIILVIYFYMWKQTYDSTKINTMLMDKYIQKINYNELNDYLVENKNTVIYSSVLGNTKTKNFEEKLTKVIEENSLSNGLLYLDLTEELKNKQIKKEILEKYPELNNNIKAPLIIVFNNEKITSIYNIKDNNYNIDKLIEYLEKEEIIND